MPGTETISRHHGPFRHRGHRRDDREVRGLTVNSLTSVSLDPLLVLWCSQSKGRLAGAPAAPDGLRHQHPGSTQRDLSSYFAGQIKDGSVPAFSLNQWRAGRASRAASRRLVADERVDEGGDHWILLAVCRGIDVAAHDPLVWFGGKYRDLGALA